MFWKKYGPFLLKWRALYGPAVMADLEWFEKEANTVDPEKDALEDQLVKLHGEWAEQIANLYTK